MSDHPLRKSIEGAFEQLKPLFPLRDPLGHSFTTLIPRGNPNINSDSKTIPVFNRKDNLGRVWSIHLNTFTGEIASIFVNGRPVFESKASSTVGLGRVIYQQYSQSDYDTFNSEYNTVNESWVKLDFGKAGMPVTDHVDAQPIATDFYVHETQEYTEIIVKLEFDDQYHIEAGAPEIVYSSYTFSFDNTSSPSSSSDTGGISIGFNIEIFNKTATRLPEAMWVSFNPGQPRADGGDTSGYSQNWKMNKLGEWVDPLYIVNNGSLHLHAVTIEGILWDNIVPASSSSSSSSSSGGWNSTIQITSRDAAVVGWGAPWAFPTPMSEQPDIQTYGGSFNLWNNLWGTNYVMWYPFEENNGEENFAFAFAIRVNLI